MTVPTDRPSRRTLSDRKDRLAEVIRRIPGYGEDTARNFARGLVNLNKQDAQILGALLNGDAPGVEDQVGEERPRKLAAPMGVKELLQVEEPEEQWLTEGVTPADSNTLTAGYPKCLKTFLLLEEAVALASGTPFLGRFPVPTRRRVGLVLMEDRDHRVRRRVERLCEGRGINLRDLDGYLHIWFRPNLRLTDITALELADYAGELDLDFLGMDSWSYVATGNSNSADEVTPQLQALSHARTQRPGLTVRLLHHARKDPADGGGKRLTDIIRNSSAFGAWYDCGMVLARKDEQSPVTARMEFRDYPEVDPFAFVMEDEHPGDPMHGVPPHGWLKLTVSATTPQTLERRVDAEKMIPAVLEFIRDNPKASHTKVRKGIKGDNAAIDAALTLLKERGTINIKDPPKPGMGAEISILLDLDDTEI